MTQKPESGLARLALRACHGAERWFPDPFIVAALAAAGVALAAIALGAPPQTAATAFGEGFWSLIPFTMQMVFVIIGGSVVAASPPVSRVIERLAKAPRSGRGAILMVTAIGMSLALLHWGLSLIFSGLLVRALARREDLDMDYRAAAAGAYVGLGSVWALGLSSSAAQLQANPASLPPALLKITGVIPFAETIFLWQSMLLAVVLLVVTLLIAWSSAPSGKTARTARSLGLTPQPPPAEPRGPARPGEWLEWSPIPSLLLAALIGGFLFQRFALKGFAAISDLNTYNLLFLMLGLLLNWRPRRFLAAATAAVPGGAGVLIQFPLYGGIAAMLTGAHAAGGSSLAEHLARAFTHIATQGSFPLVVGVYSSVLGFLVPSGGGKWIIEAPYVMQAANDLHAHLGWAVQVYNAAEALPNLINPFWMLPLLGMLGLKARQMVGFTVVQFVVLLPLTLVLLWLLGLTLSYHAPVMPTGSG